MKRQPKATKAAAKTASLAQAPTAPAPVMKESKWKSGRNLLPPAEEPQALETVVQKLLNGPSATSSNNAAVFLSPFSSALRESDTQRKGGAYDSTRPTPVSSKLVRHVESQCSIFKSSLQLDVDRNEAVVGGMQLRAMLDVYERMLAERADMEHIANRIKDAEAAELAAVASEQARLQAREDELEESKVRFEQEHVRCLDELLTITTTVNERQNSIRRESGRLTAIEGDMRELTHEAASMGRMGRRESWVAIGSGLGESSAGQPATLPAPKAPGSNNKAASGELRRRSAKKGRGPGPRQTKASELRTSLKR